MTFFCYDVRTSSYALIAQLDRVQVSEACGVGSSPAERTIYKKHKALSQYHLPKKELYILLLLFLCIVIPRFTTLLISK